MKHWPPPKDKYLKDLFTLAIYNKQHEDAFIHRRGRGSRPLCDAVVPLEGQTLEDGKVTCPVCIARLKEFKHK